MLQRERRRKEVERYWNLQKGLERSESLISSMCMGLMIKISKIGDSAETKERTGIMASWVTPSTSLRNSYNKIKEIQSNEKILLLFRWDLIGEYKRHR